MTIKNKIAAIAVPALLIASPVLAAAAGQIEGGSIYNVKNVTKNTAYGDPINADKCETVKFSVRIHNPGPDALTAVNVKATLPTAVATSHSSMVTVTAANANPKTTTDTAGVKLSSAQSISYVTGSTQLFDANGSLMSNLPDGILGNGVTIGNVGVSTQQLRFVQFQAKVNCPVITPEVPEQPKPTPTPNPTPTPAPAPEAPAALPETGPAAGLAAAAGTSAMGYAVMAYRRSKRAIAEKLLDVK